MLYTVAHGIAAARAMASLRFQVPLPEYRAAPESPTAAMLFTGADESTSTALAGNLFAPNTLTAAALAAPVATFQSQAAQVCSSCWKAHLRDVAKPWSLPCQSCPIKDVFRRLLQCDFPGLPPGIHRHALQSCTQLLLFAHGSFGVSPDTLHLCRECSMGSCSASWGLCWAPAWTPSPPTSSSQLSSTAQ